MFRLLFYIILSCTTISVSYSQCNVSISSLETQNYLSYLKAILKFNNDNSDKITIYYGYEKNNLIPIVEVYSSEFKHEFLPTRNVFYKVVKETANGCRSESEIVQSIFVEVKNSNYGQVDIAWNDIGDNMSYDILRNGGLYRTVSTNKYSDIRLDCNKSYLYQIVSKYNTIKGEPVTVKSQIVASYANFFNYSPSKQAIASTVLDNNRVRISILDTTGRLTYNLYRDNGTLIASQQSSVFEDTVDVVGEKPCYYITHTDACNFNSQQSLPFCPIVLERKNDALVWNAPSKTPNVSITYKIIETQSQRELATTGNRSLDLIGLPNKPIEKYQVVATLSFNISGEIKEITVVSNILEVNFASQIFAPNAFTPNGDGKNDIFYIKAEESKILTYNLQIFNNWGDLIFETDDITQGWDGTISGVFQPVGLYVYKVFTKNLFNIETQNKGSITLIR